MSLGHLAALRESLLGIGTESRHNIVIDPILSGVGPALATDIHLVKESVASIICFNLKNEQTILGLAENEKVPLLNSKVILLLSRDYRPARVTRLIPREKYKPHHHTKQQLISCQMRANEVNWGAQDWSASIDIGNNFTVAGCARYCTVDVSLPEFRNTSVPELQPQ